MSMASDAELQEFADNDPIFEAFSPRDYPLILIALIRKKNTQSIDRLISPYGLNTNMWRVFGALQDNDGLHISDLSERIAIERTQLSRILDQMETMGHIRRTVSEVDRRQTKLFFTKKGRKAFHEILPIVVRHYEAVCSDLTATEMKILMRSLHKMLDRFEASAP